MQLGFISMKMLKKTFSATSQIWLHILPGNSCSRPLDLNCSLHRVSFIIIILWIQILKSFGRFTCIPCVNHQLCLELSFGESVAVVVEVEPDGDVSDKNYKEIMLNLFSAAYDFIRSLFGLKRTPQES